MNAKDRDFFDSIADQWDTIAVVEPNKIKHILEVSKIKDGDEILDVGTGTGVLVPYLSKLIGKEGKIDAIDISQGMLNVAKQKYSGLGNVEFKLIDAEGDILSDKYDHIFMYCMYPHLLHGEDTVEWLTKLNLKPGGNLIIAFPENKESINTIHHHNDGTVHSTHLIDGNSFKSLLEARGLKVDYIEDNDDYYIIRVTK